MVSAATADAFLLATNGPSCLLEPRSNRSVHFGCKRTDKFKTAVWPPPVAGGRVVLLPGSALALVAAPFLPRLVYEGFPAQRWPCIRSSRDRKGQHVRTPARQRFFRESHQRKIQVAPEDRGGAAPAGLQGGKLQARHFAAGSGPETRFNSFSMVKSLVGALVLRARADGLIGDLADPIGNYLPAIGDETFRAVPIDRFLRMRSGVALETAGLMNEDQLKPVEDLCNQPVQPARAPAHERS